MRVIPLSNGGAALVDDDQYELLYQHKWFRMSGSKSRTAYAVRTLTSEIGRRVMLMHREIMDAVPGQELDHINDNGLDNRRQNLRFVTSSVNKVARTIKPGRSGFKGVKSHPSTPSRFQAIITIGTFNTAEAAARSYDEVAAALWGEDARLNFPVSPHAQMEAAE